MGNSSNDTKKVIKEKVIGEKLREYGVPEEDIKILFGEEFNFAFWVTAMVAFANLPPRLILTFEQDLRRKDIQKYIDELESLSTISKDDSLISMLGSNKDNMSRAANSVLDNLKRRKKGRSSSKKYFLDFTKKNTGSKSTVNLSSALEGIQLRLYHTIWLRSIHPLLHISMLNLYGICRRHLSCKTARCFLYVLPRLS